MKKKGFCRWIKIFHEILHFYNKNDCLEKKALLLKNKYLLADDYILFQSLL
jgi:hypothetical protein